MKMASDGPSIGKLCAFPSTTTPPPNESAEGEGGEEERPTDRTAAARGVHANRDLSDQPGRPEFDQPGQHPVACGRLQAGGRAPEP